MKRLLQTACGALALLLLCGLAVPALAQDEAGDTAETETMAAAEPAEVWWGNRSVSNRNYIEFDRIDMDCPGVCEFCTPDMICCETGCPCASCQHICDHCDDCGPTWDRIFFDLDKSFLRPDAIRECEKVLAYMLDNPEKSVLIEGHACDLASNSYNQALGQRRADAVATYLVENGIAPARIQTQSYGERDPWQPVSQRALNRRAVVQVHAR